MSITYIFKVWPETSYNDRYERAVSGNDLTYGLSYATYAILKIKEDYIDDFYGDSSGPWTFALHLKSLVNKLNSHWISSVIGDYDEMLLEIPLEGCQVHSYKMKHQNIY